MRVVIQPAATSDLRQGFSFYEQQQEGLGSYFLHSLYAEIDSLRLYSGIHPVHFGRFFRMLPKRFPYGVYYEFKDNTVFVRAVLDLRRNPRWIRDEIKGRN